MDPRSGSAATGRRMLNRGGQLLWPLGGGWESRAKARQFLGAALQRPSRKSLSPLLCWACCIASLASIADILPFGSCPATMLVPAPSAANALASATRPDVGQLFDRAGASTRALLTTRRGRRWTKNNWEKPDLKAEKREMRGRFHRGGIKMATTEFAMPSEPRGTTQRGKKNHFHLLDRYIRRIDSLVPEDMEDLVRPLSYKPNQEKTSHTLKITLDVGVDMAVNVTEDDVRIFLSPLVPTGIALGWTGSDGESEVYVQFDTNEDCQAGRQLDGKLLGSGPAKVRYSVDNKFRRVCEDLGLAGPDMVTLATVAA
uniref:Uncharacterized protein n=1 Tax=Alexandrium catenella TaxID=2925 RepID=A0A7S1PV99_ALECA